MNKTTNAPSMSKQMLRTSRIGLAVILMSGIAQMLTAAPSGGPYRPHSTGVAAA